MTGAEAGLMYDSPPILILTKQNMAGQEDSLLSPNNTANITTLQTSYNMATFPTHSIQPASAMQATAAASIHWTFNIRERIY